MKKKVVIVGGVAGGASAAARLRRLEEEAEIILLERGEHISFANCGLPYYIGGVIDKREKLLVQTPEAMKERFNIDVRIQSEVIKLDAQNKKLLINSASRGIYEETYDYLILSPGAKAVRPPIPGIDSPRILTLRNIPDTDAIKEMVEKQNVQKAIIIGGGFVGVEMAENLRKNGKTVILVEAAPHILAPFDTDMVLLAEKECRDQGIELILRDGVKAFQDLEKGIEVILNSERKLQGDLVILAIGVTPDTDFLKDSGLELGPKGHIIVNEYLETNLPNVYAVGDAVEVVDYITKTKTAVPLAGPANKQGRIAADNVAGLGSRYKGTQGTSILKIFGLTAASTGANERTLKRENIPYHVIHIHPVSHASYYPNALPMTLKLIFSPEGKVLGAQAIGRDGVDKRIDVLATVIRLGGTVQDLTELELAYAPPYSSAKDPVNIAGYVAQNVLNNKAHMLVWDDLDKIQEDYIFVDVRTRGEFARGHVEGAINVPLDELRYRLNELDPNKLIIVYCQVGLRGYIADRILSQKGYRVLNLTGGYTSYTIRGFDPSKALDEYKSTYTTCCAQGEVDPETQRIRTEMNFKN